MSDRQNGGFSMSGFDILILILLFVALVTGWRKGLVMELAGFVGFMISVYVAKYYSGISLYLLESFGVGQEISPIFSFAITFILCMIAVWFLAKMISKFFSIISLGWLNGLLGGLFSLLKYALVFSVLFNLFDLANKRLELVNNGKDPNSSLYSPIRSFAPAVLPYINMEDITGKLKGVMSKDKDDKSASENKSAK